VPSEYLNYWEVFSKARATSLPPHRPYDARYVLIDVLNKLIFVYLDDILIFSKFRDQTIQTVLQRLLENSLFMKVEKCNYHVPTVSFLGYIMAQGSLQMDPAKVFVVGLGPFPILASSCNDSWGSPTFTADSSDCQTLKARFTSASILQVPDLDCQFVVEVDESNVGAGTVLSQRAAVDLKLHPCAFFSLRLIPTDRL